MNVEIYPEPAKNLEKFGEWYILRKTLFTEAVPMDYIGKKIPGIEINDDKFGVIGAFHENDHLIHLINFNGTKKEIKLSFTSQHWGSIVKILLEPDKKELEYSSQDTEIIVNIHEEDLDLADTILRVIKKK